METYTIFFPDKLQSVQANYLFILVRKINNKEYRFNYQRKQDSTTSQNPTHTEKSTHI